MAEERRMTQKERRIAMRLILVRPAPINEQERAISLEWQIKEFRLAVGRGMMTPEVKKSIAEELLNKLREDYGTNRTISSQVSLGFRKYLRFVLKLAREAIERRQNHHWR